MFFFQVKEVTTSSSSDGESSDSDASPQNYVIHNYYWYWLFKFGTMLGEEIFYASVFPFWFWNIDGAVGRRIINVLALHFYRYLMNIFIIPIIEITRCFMLK